MFKQSPDDLRLLWNAVVSMNSVAEWIALHKLDYAEVDKRVLDDKAKEVRNSDSSLKDLNLCAITFKHVRKLIPTPTGLIPSSTALSTPPWVIGYGNEEKVVEDVLRRAYAALLAFPELAS